MRRSRTTLANYPFRKSNRHSPAWPVARPDGGADAITVILRLSTPERIRSKSAVDIRPVFELCCHVCWVLCRVPDGDRKVIKKQFEPRSDTDPRDQYSLPTCSSNVASLGCCELGPGTTELLDVLRILEDSNTGSDRGSLICR